MKVTILQRNIEWANPSLNIHRADEAIDRNPGADLYVYPKCFPLDFVHIPKVLLKVWIAIASSG